MTHQPTVKSCIFWNPKQWPTNQQSNAMFLGVRKTRMMFAYFDTKKKIDKTWKTIAYKVNHNPILSNRHLFACPSQTGDYHIKLHHTKYTLVAHKTSRRFHTWNFTFCLIPSKVSPLSHFKIRRSWLRKLGIMCHYPHLIVSTKPEDFSL